MTAKGVAAMSARGAPGWLRYCGSANAGRSTANEPDASLSFNLGKSTNGPDVATATHCARSWLESPASNVINESHDF